MEAALPAGWGDLEYLIPANQIHRYALSGKSSQTLALGLLGTAAKLQPDLAWLFSALDLEPTADPEPLFEFEHTVSEELLGERPHQTTIDFLGETVDAVVCVEAKFREPGLGRCRCRQEGGTTCSARVLGRAAYRQSARRDFGFSWPGAGPCQVATHYQAVRNAAVAHALAEGRRAVFCLAYDARNPYFARCGEWPGWAAMLNRARVAPGGVELRALSWQELVPKLSLDDAARRWAVEKHELRG